MARTNSTVAKINKSLRGLIESYGIAIVEGDAKLKDKNTVSVDSNDLKCKNIILATGSKPTQIEGLECDGEFIINSDQALMLDTFPDEVLIVGSGAIGVEWARIFSSFGKKVTIVEMAENLLPYADKDISIRLERLLKKSRITFYKSTSIENIKDGTVILSNGKVLTPDKIFVAAGRTPVFDKESLNSLGVDFDRFVNVDNNFKTSVDNIYAIGDIVGPMLLAHAASHQAAAVAEHIIKGTDVHYDVNQVPSVVYGNPEIAQIGITEQQAQSSELSYKVSNFPIAALGKAQADDEIDGLIKLIEVEGEIKGAHIVSPEASAIIQQVAVAMHSKDSAKVLAETVFAHPTYSEGLYEAVLGLDNLSLHLPKVQN